MYCENCKVKFWNYLSVMPIELNDIIFSYVKDEEKVFLNKEYYEKHHNLIRPKLGDQKNYDNYIRDMIRNDCDFVLKQLLEENYEPWIKKKRVAYKNTIYPHYAGYILDLCINYNSTKCREKIVEFYEIKGLSKNLHKKNRNINKRWTQ